jgi:hypothetical protein
MVAFAMVDPTQIAQMAASEGEDGAIVIGGGRRRAALSRAAVVCSARASAAWPSGVQEARP